MKLYGNALADKFHATLEALGDETGKAFREAEAEGRRKRDARIAAEEKKKYEAEKKYFQELDEQKKIAEEQKRKAEEEEKKKKKK